MHNGIYKTLEEVVELYNNGGGSGLGFDLAHQTLASDSLHLTKSEITDLVNFMKTLEEQEVYYILFLIFQKAKNESIKSYFSG